MPTIPKRRQMPGKPRCRVDKINACERGPHGLLLRDKFAVPSRWHSTGRLALGYVALLFSIILLLPVQTSCMSSTGGRSERDREPQDVARLSAMAQQRCKARGYPAGEPSRPFATDGCTAWPDDVVLSCCMEHDMTYWCGGSRDARKQADAALRDCVVAAYGEWPGPVLGWMMQAGVTSAGSPHLPTYWRWGYGHEFGGGYSDGSGPEPDHPE